MFSPKLCILLTAVLNVANGSRAPRDSSAVNFGGPTQRRLVKASPCSNGKDFCAEAEDYPEDYPRINMTPSTRAGLFQTVTKNPELNLRGGDFDQELRACDVRRSTVFPRKARDLSGEFKFIINNEDHVQSLEVEECIGEGLKCLVDEDDAPSPGSTVCRQKYAKYQLVSIDNNGKDAINSFQLPSACICHHTRRASANFDGFELRFATKTEDHPLPYCPSIQESQITPRIQVSSEPTGQDDISTVNGKPQNINPDRIFYPAMENQNSRRYRHVEPPRSFQRRLRARGCNSTSFCVESKSYPTELIDILIEVNSKLPSRFINKFLKQACTDPAEEIITRQFSLNEEQLCQANKRTIIPKEAKNIQNKWRFIVNSQNHTQTVTIEECVGHGQSNREKEAVGNEDFGSCLYSGILGNIPSQTTCKQLYREHKLLVITEKGKLEVDNFRLPSACACYLRKEFANFEFRRSPMKRRN